ncbi:uncharacterized protein RJT20DRAFT_53214 [Scheffersomyces xylosifermentans]|uniref:uncharacterized protein n=1 Tax=Scheffersomyces xylosifermentans TaxID=1304137 RepID=UPI00315C61D2
MTTTYSADIAKNAELHRFITDFYKVSDVKPPAENDPYLDYFVESATVIMASNKFEGSNAIAGMRHGMWTYVTKRHHVALNVATVVEDKDYLINGYVDYTLTNGKELRSEWAAFARFSSEDKSKMEFYQVYLDPTKMKEALTEN